MTGRALVFGSAAVAYERFRLDYPATVRTSVLGYARGPVRTALEIGAGTGKATRLFATHGIAVTAVEPDAAMIDQLRAHVCESVTVVHSALEDVPVTHPYDLVYAAASLHWTDPEGRWTRIASLLAPGGVFASFGAPIRLADPQLDDAVRRARSAWLAEDDVPLPGGADPAAAMRWPGSELQRCELFTDIREVILGRRVTTTGDDYVGLLSTISAYLQLAEADRRDALVAIREVLPSTVTLVADVHLHLARAR